MKIDATNSATQLPGAERRVAAPRTDTQDAAHFAESSALTQKMAQTPEARPDAVARARALIVQPDYPPDITVRGIANLIASNFYPEEE